ncbi:MAG: VWA domain-containing protein [Planctomycetota bacterium]|jgi:Ca-activated chloride channel family protein|nr:VWA domain-containing protein [Planctomycetota bacterium]
MSEWQLGSPWFLLIALAVFPLSWMMRRSRSTLAFSSTTAFEGLSRTIRSRLSSLPNLLFLAAIVLLSIAMARPQTADDTSRVSREGVAIMLVVDRSGSMDARDLEKEFLNVNRLEVVKDVLHYFITGSDTNERFESLIDGQKRKFTNRGRPDDMIGLVTFAGFSDSVCPLTLDHGNLLETINEVKLADRSEGGTAIGEGLGLAVERLRRSEVESKIVILLTDGVNNTGELVPLKAGDLAAKEKIKVYCIGAGTNGYAPFPVPNPLTGRTELQAVPVEIDEVSLKAIAEKTGGKYFRAMDKEALKSIYDEIDQLEKTEVSQLKYLNFYEHYPVFLVVGLACLTTGWVLQMTFLRRFP